MSRMDSVHLKRSRKLQNSLYTDKKQSEDRGQRMVGMYLELASTGGKYTYSHYDISEIKKEFARYETNLSKSDVIQKLLNVGIQEGKPLSADEIVRFLKVTKNIDDKELNNLTTFLNEAKENDAQETVDYLLKGFNPQFVKTVAASSDARTLFAITQLTGVNYTVSVTGEDLLNIYKLSGRNKDLVYDISKVFYIPEIKQISAELSKDVKTGKPPKLLTYRKHTVEYYQKNSTTPHLNIQRKSILNDINLIDRVQLLPLQRYHDKLIVGIEDKMPKFGSHGEGIS